MASRDPETMGKCAAVRAGGVRDGARRIPRTRAAAGAVCALALSGVAACAPRGPELLVDARLPLSVDSPATLAIDGQGGLWVGAPGALYLLRGAAAEPVWVTPLDTSAVPRPIAQLPAATLVRAGARVLLVDPLTGSRLAERSVGEGPVFGDVRGRFLFRAAATGAVFLHDLPTLEPVLVWAAQGEAPVGLAGSPEGDMLYLPLESGTVQQRDLQTGRLLGGGGVQAAVHALTATPDGDLLGVAGGMGGPAVLRLRPRLGGLRRVWRRPLRGDAASAALRLSRDGTRIAVLFPGSETGLHVLDAETGSDLGVVSDAPLDADFSPAGDLFLLYPDGIRVVGATRLSLSAARRGTRAPAAGSAARRRPGRAGS